MRNAFEIVMRIVSSLLGVLLIALGCVWIMQGLDVGPRAILQGFMVNDIHWSIYGAILVLVGVAQIVWTNSRRSMA